MLVLILFYMSFCVNYAMHGCLRVESKCALCDLCCLAWFSFSKRISKCMFGIVVQGAFRLKMHQNDFFPHF
jgi:hypothetical protein